MKLLFLATAMLLPVATLSQPKEVTIAMAQIFLLDGDVAGNFARIENAIVEAKAKQADIVTFPESSLLGWLNSAAHKRANSIPGADSDKLCALAKKYNIHICIGLDEKENQNLYGAALLIDDKGKILLKHRKINVLAELMDPPYSVGASVETVETKFGRIGLLICADSFQDDLLLKMRSKGPALLIIPYGWAADESEWPQHGKELEQVVRNAAVKVGCPVIGTDLVGEISDGPWKGKTYGGQSYASDKTGKVIAVGKDRDREVIIVKVKL
jgi:predicted amidohydrolase